MKLQFLALLFAATSVLAAEPDSQSATRNATTEPASGTVVSTGSAAGSPWAPQRADEDQSSDEDGWTTTSGNINYESGAICITKGAGGICLEDDGD